MNIYKIGIIKEKKKFLRDLGVQGGGVSIMSDKMELLEFFIKDLRTPAINILKQDALSIGAELAVPSGAITCEKEFFDCLLIGTKKQIKILSKKELAQPFGLKELAKELQKSLVTEEYPTQIMGVINANEDSFFAGSRSINESSSTSKIEQMIEDGADIIDIGAVSSRPNASVVTAKEEFERIKPICDVIKSKSLYKKVEFSIDSYTPSVVEYALESGFRVINDITGARDNKIIELATRYKAKLCIMHMQGTPQTMQKNPSYSDVTAEVSSFFEEQIAKCAELGLNKESIILDVGIGFGKTLEHNIELIKNMSHFKKFGCQILVGASRKSMIDRVIPTAVEDRVSGTLAIHLKAVENGANIIRCHDVKEHIQAISLWNSFN